MVYREAHLADIPQMMEVRMAVKENVLSNPELVTYKDNEAHLTLFGKGWVCQKDNNILGFSIVNLQTKNIWHCLYIPILSLKELERNYMK